jgi:hypothetical protein
LRERYRINECNRDISTANQTLLRLGLAYNPGGETFMDYIKVILSGLAAIFLAWVVVLWPVFRHISGAKAIGLDVSVAVLSAPALWILAGLFFALFVAASRIGNTPLKVSFFWIPTLLLSTSGVAIAALLTYAFIRLKHLSTP